MDRDEAKVVLVIVGVAIALVIGTMIYSLKTYDKVEDPVYKCKVTDGREFLAYERNLLSSRGLVKAKGHDGGSTWYDIMVPVIAVDACIKTEQVMP
jgi:hypothetical protein